MQRLTFTIKDAKGQLADLVLNFPDDVIEIHIYDAAYMFATLLNPLTTGQLVEITHTQEIIIALGDPPAAYSDVEEKAKLYFQSAYAHRVYSQSIAAIDESKAERYEHGELLDLSDPDVAAWIAAMVDGVEVDDFVFVHPSDARGSDLSQFIESDYIFKPRKRRKHRLF